MTELRNEMLSLKETAEVFRFGLMVGLIKLENVLDWVDLEISRNNSPDIALIEIGFNGSKGLNEVISRLGDITGEQDYHKPAQIILGLIYQDLISGKSGLEINTYRLYSLSNILNELNIEKEILTELNIMDEYHHIYSNEQIRNKIIQLLKNYEEIANEFNNSTSM